MRVSCFLDFFCSSRSLEIGEKAPELIARDQDNRIVDFGQLYKKGILLVYFYPKADTSGCTAQACSLRDAFEELTKNNVAIIGVSTDQAEVQKQFKEKYGLPFTLIADVHGEVIRAFRVKRMPLVGLASRQAFLIQKGTVLWQDSKASTKEQANDVLKALAVFRNHDVDKTDLS